MRREGDAYVAQRSNVTRPPDNQFIPPMPVGGSSQAYMLSHLTVSGPTYDEIAALLSKAGYQTAFPGVGIDMNGIRLLRAEERDLTRQCPVCGVGVIELTAHGDKDRSFACKVGCGARWHVPFPVDSARP